jgi:hypothetical protein
LIFLHFPPRARQPVILWGIIGLSTMLGPVGIFALRNLIQKKDEPAAATA